jgi:hypothetical protein
VSAPLPWNPRAWRGEALWSVRDVARPFEQFTDWPSVEDYDAILAARAGVRFRPQAPTPRRARRAGRPAPRRYDAVICEEGVVPTRAKSWHDFFNALVWAAFPRAKRALHLRQYHLGQYHLRQCQAAGNGLARRTREGDGLALLDEGGVVLVCARASAAAVTTALVERAHEPIVALARAGGLSGAVYGHAVLEHLAHEATAVRAMAHVAVGELGDEDGCRRSADEALAAALADPAAFTDPSALSSVPTLVELLRPPAQRPG